MSWFRKERNGVQLEMKSHQTAQNEGLPVCSVIIDCLLSVSASGSDVSVDSPVQTEEKPKAKKNRCFTCRKKVGLTGTTQAKEGANTH